MPETLHAHFHLDPPVPPGTTLYAGPVLLRGWALGRHGTFLTDLRVRVGGRIFPVFHGHPRPDVAEFLQLTEPLVPAGFEVELLLADGENHVEFEACEIDGHWRALATPVITATPAQPVPWRTEAGTVQPHEFARALRLVLQGSAGGAAPAVAAADVVSWLPVPFVTRYPALPFHGHLHQPPLLQRADFGRLIIEGWLFHETEKIRRVAATVDLQAWTRLEHGGEHPYVAGLFPQFPQARTCRVEGFIDVPSQLPQPVSIRLYAELSDGSWHLCHVQRSHIYDGEANKAPYGRFSALRFLRAAAALRTACLNRGLLVPGGAWFFRALREVWTEYRARAAEPGSVPSPPVEPAKSNRPLRHVLLATHNLNYEGAPLFLLEYAGGLRAGGTTLTVVSTLDGPLRARFEALGASVQLIDASSLHQARTAAEMRRALSRMSQAIDLSRADLVVANTLSTFWAVHLADRAGKRSLLSIHESTTPDAFYHGHLPPATLPVVKRAFTLASHVSFLTEATRRYYRPLLRRANHSINPGWIDLKKLDLFRSARPRGELRAPLGLTSGTKLVVNVGTVCDRKGQHIFARAVDLFWRRQPALAADCLFLMVGGRDTAFDRHLATLIEQLNRPNLRVVKETTQPYDYYGAADLFVCSSYEESFPRVVLEAGAFALPIVSSDVHGVPEIVRPEREALLVPPGDSAALAAAMIRVLQDDALARRLAQQARERIVRNFDAKILLPRHAALAMAIGSGGAPARAEQS